MSEASESKTRPALDFPSPLAKDLLTEAQTITALGLQDLPKPSVTLRNLVRAKKLRCVRIARGIIRFDPKDVAAFIEAHRGE